MKYTEEFLLQVRTIGTLNYHVEKMSNILDIPDDKKAEFIKDFSDLSGELRIAYQKGVDKSEFVIDQVIFEKAQTGDLSAVREYEKRKMRQLKNK